MGILRCYVSGVEYTMDNKYSIKEQAGQTSTSKINVLKGTNNPIKSQELVEIKTQDGTPVFTGIVQEDSTPEWVTVYKTYLYELQVKDIEVVFDQRLINESYNNMFVNQIVRDIFDNYLLEEGLTLGEIEDFEYEIEKYVIPNLKCRDVLDYLGDLVSAVPRISADRVFSFKSRLTFTASSHPSGLILPKVIDNGQGLVTVQKVAGATEETSTQSQSFIWGADQETATLRYQVSSVIGITINGSSVNFGVLGVSDNDPGVTFLTKYGSYILTLSSNAATKPSENDNVTISYRGFYNIETSSTNFDLLNEIKALNGTSGKIESVETDTSITSYEDAQNLANSKLDSASIREKTLTVSYRSADISQSTILNAWNFTEDYLSALGISGEYVVVERTITDFYDKLNVALKLKNKNFWSRYGTIYNKNDKQINNLSINTDRLILKQSQINENYEPEDEFQFHYSNIFSYPSSGDFIQDPSGLDSFYPA